MVNFSWASVRGSQGFFHINKETIVKEGQRKKYYTGPPNIKANIYPEDKFMLHTVVINGLYGTPSISLLAPVLRQSHCYHV